jgi:hypothetical protein
VQLEVALQFRRELTLGSVRDEDTGEPLEPSAC